MVHRPEPQCLGGRATEGLIAVDADPFVNTTRGERLDLHTGALEGGATSIPPATTTALDRRSRDMSLGWGGRVAGPDDQESVGQA
jgi:hypothetical protein